jgi:cation:H+ antiporter
MRAVDEVLDYTLKVATSSDGLDEIWSNGSRDRHSIHSALRHSNAQTCQYSPWSIAVIEFVKFTAGLILLLVGADLVIRGAVRIARWLGISPLMIGLTLVGFGTSAPELIVGISSAIQGQPNLSIGNVIGSNVANIGLILAVTAIIRPLDARMRLLQVEIPAMNAALIAVLIMGIDHRFDRGEGAILLLGFMVVMMGTIWAGPGESPETKAELGQLTEANIARPTRAVAFVVIGVALLGVGADLIVDAAVAAARRFAVPDHIIGMTIVAIGTTLPELAASITAARKGESDIALGNAVGSVLFNVLLIIGTVVVIHPADFTAAPIRIELGIMVMFGLALFPILWNGLKINRFKGAFLLLAYGGFILWQVFRV